jgi:hypothetical protein
MKKMARFGKKSLHVGANTIKGAIKCVKSA